MEIFILGSGTCEPNPNRGHSGIAIRLLDGQIILFDSGSGTIQKMAQMGLDYRQVDYLCYSHIHADHTTDLITFLFATNCLPQNPRVKPLHIVGPKGFRKFIKQLVKSFPQLEPKSYEILLHQVASSRLRFPNFIIRTKPMAHGELPAVGYRLEYNHKVLVYSGDTGYCDNIITLAQNADALILECSLPEEYAVDTHLCPSLAGKLANLANVKRLVLTHLYSVCDRYPILDRCKQEYSGDVQIASDLMTIQV
ncbi:MAG: MBL fold metallo-hydrolase [bacterium]|nr:MBL fold metallo-hydrolase [bacterium]